MLVVKIIALALGIAFFLFGYFIYFKKKYNLINGYNDNYEDVSNKEQYAKRVGLIEFVVGIVLFVSGVVLIVVYK